jgi:hypothetical protein
MEFLARVLVQIPGPKRHLVRYFSPAAPILAASRVGRAP